MPSTSTLSTDLAGPVNRRRIDPAQRHDEAVLLTLAYSDVFDYALSEAEIERNLVAEATRDQVADALARLIPDRVERADGGLLTLSGRTAIAPLRARRRDTSAPAWRQARRFGRVLARVPFVRMLAVCGSVAVDNAGEDGDVDLFIVTAPGRLWLVQAATMVLRRLAPTGDMTICPNYLLAEDDLAVEPRNLFTAHEVTQTVPLFGGDVFARFRAENAWTADFLPQAIVDCDAPPRPAPGPFSRFFERLLGGRLGDLLDAAVHRVQLGYYRLRLRRRGFAGKAIASAYRRGRQTLIGGGFVGAVESRFMERAEAALGAAEPARDAFRGTGPDRDPEAGGKTAPAHFAQVFEGRYGPKSRYGPKNRYGAERS